MADATSGGMKPVIWMMLGMVIGGAAGWMLGSRHGRGTPHFRRIRFVNASDKIVKEVKFTPGVGAPNTTFANVMVGGPKYTTMTYGVTSAVAMVDVTGTYTDGVDKTIGAINFNPGGDSMIDEVFVVFGPDYKFHGFAWSHPSDEDQIADAPQIRTSP